MLVCLVTVTLLYRHIKSKWLPGAIICLLAILCSYWTFERNKIWQDDITLWTDVTNKSPNKAMPYSNLAVAQVRQNMLEAAVQNSLKSLQLKPDYAEAHNNLGGQLLKEGNIDEALGHFNAALKTNPDMAETHNNVGIILIHKGKISEAVFHFQEAVRINPEFELAKDNLRRALAIQQSQIDMEMERILAALKNNPDDPVLNYVLGNLYLGKGELNNAIGQFKKTLSLHWKTSERLRDTGKRLKDGKG